MTAQQIIDMAVERSNLNDSDLIPEAQLLDYITAYERLAFQIAARGNPDYFGREGNTDARATSSDSWSLTSAPGNIAAVSKITVAAITGTVTGISTGDDVNVVSIRNPEDGLAPRVYIRNKTIREYNSELQDDSSNFVTRLKIFYSYLPVDKTSTTDSMEIPDEWNNLVVLPLAGLLALRDQREAEAQVLGQEYSTHLDLFINSLGVYDEATIRELKQMAASVPGV